jgi:hypothetical protein
MSKQCFHITAAAYDVEDQHVFSFNAVDDDVLAHGKTAQAGAQVFIAAAAHMGMGGKKKKPVGAGINHAVGNLDAVAFLGGVIPNVV